MSEVQVFDLRFMNETTKWNEWNELEARRSPSLSGSETLADILFRDRSAPKRFVPKGPTIEEAVF